ncbi:MAG: methyltransferase dimerization domain-containing protein, partial [Tissierellia bacterium]|nr:methyltransferase dimerization domain-containing protein [Tissierellia bacterium]
MENLSVDDFYQIINDYLRAQLFFSALKLDIFTQLDEFITAKEIAKNTGYDFTNLNWFLTALACEGFIEKRDDRFKNIENKSKLLSKNNKFYIGDS